MDLPRGRYVFRASLFCIAIAGPSTLVSQECSVITSRTSLAALSGRRIDSVRIVTAAPEALPGPLHLLDLIHVRTRDRTVRRLLLFSAGENVDSLKVVETLRRLREGRIFTDVSLAATDCGPGTPTSITVFTRDVWTTRPRLTVRATNSNSIGFEERNFLGTGRGISMSLANDQGRVAAVASLSDPALFGRDINANLRYARYGDGTGARALLQTRERSAYDLWRNAFFVSSTRHAADLDTAEYSLSRDVYTGLIGPRVYYDRDKAMYALFGGEYENTLLHVNSASQLLGPDDVERRFRAVDVGLGVRTAHYAVTDWLVPRKTIVDIPLGFEGEAVLGMGREVSTDLSMLHLDLWAGRMWLPRPTTLFVTDVWAYGYSSDGGIESGSYRGQLSIYQAARGGQWLARVAGERLLSPDPDVRALATVDPLIRFLSPNTRLAETALLATVERSWHVWSPIQSFTLDGALFTTASRREGFLGQDGSSVTVYAAVIGAGFRVVPTTSGVGPGRFDVIYPLARSPTLARKIMLSISVAPWLGADRHRDSFRDR